MQSLLTDPAITAATVPVVGIELGRPALTGIRIALILLLLMGSGFFFVVRGRPVFAPPHTRSTRWSKRANAVAGSSNR